MPMLACGDAQVHFERAGQGPPILFVQGVGVIGRGWTPQIDGVSDAYTSITFDNRGIGRSTLGSGPLSIERLAADALAIMDDQGFDAFHVVGHSMGGVIAQAIALSAPGRVKSLALLCTFRRGAEATSLSWRMLALGLRTRVGTRRMRRRAFVELVMPPSALAGADRDALAASLAPLFGRDLADQPPIVMAQLRAMSHYDAAARLASLGRIPTLVVTGCDDVIARPSFGRDLAAAIPNARYVELDRAGHGLPIHDAARLNSLLREHVDAVERAGAATQAADAGAPRSVPAALLP